MRQVCWGHKRGDTMGHEQVVTLTWYEVRLGATVGLERRVRAMQAGYPDRNFQTDSNRWNDHVEGALAEMAVAKQLGQFWNGSIDTYRDGGDVGAYQVRSSPSIHDMVVRDRDKDEEIFVKVFGRAPTFTIYGWITGAEAKRDEWRGDRGNGGPPAFWVPRDRLHPLSELPRGGGHRA